MKTIHLTMLAALLASLSTAATAQEAAVATQTFRFDSAVVDPRSGIMVMRSGIVKNAPYSAEAVTERLQTLADGNQIVQRNSTMTYRDSAGRTRREVRDAKGEVVAVTINDPAAAVNLVLRPRERSAIRIGAPGLAAQAAADKARTAADLPGVERRQLADGSEAVIIKRVERADGEARQRIQQDVRIQVSKALSENAAALRDMQVQVAPLTRGAFGDARWAAKAVTKELGAREIGGVRAEGRLRSYEIPAGEIGNSRPIVVSDETWTAPELQVAVYTKHSDPRSGEVVFRLENIRREEPAAALFAVPADYTVKDPMGQLKAKPQ